VAATFPLPYTPSNGFEFVSIHSDPPGTATEIPAVVVKKYGKGRVIWSSLPLECGETEEYGDILLSLIKRLDALGAPSFESNAPVHVEITLFEAKGEKLVNCVALDSGYKSAPVSPFEIKVKCDTPPKSVTLLPDGNPLDFTYEDGYVSFTARLLNTFDMYRIY
jgi:hypothetical protein